MRCRYETGIIVCVSCTTKTRPETLTQMWRIHFHPPSSAPCSTWAVTCSSRSFGSYARWAVELMLHSQAPSQAAVPCSMRRWAPASSGSSWMQGLRTWSGKWPAGQYPSHSAHTVLEVPVHVSFHCGHAVTFRCSSAVPVLPCTVTTPRRWALHLQLHSKGLHLDLYCGGQRVSGLASLLLLAAPRHSPPLCGGVSALTLNKVGYVIVRSPSPRSGTPLLELQTAR